MPPCPEGMEGISNSDSILRINVRSDALHSRAKVASVSQFELFRPNLLSDLLKRIARHRCADYLTKFIFFCARTPHMHRRISKFFSHIIHRLELPLFLLPILCKRKFHLRIVHEMTEPHADQSKLSAAVEGRPQGRGRRCENGGRGGRRVG